MEAVELAIPTAVPVPILMGTEGFGAAKPGGVAGGEGCDAGQGSIFSRSRMKICSAVVGDRDSVSSVHTLEPSTWINKADTESGRNTVQFSRLLKDHKPHELDDGAMSNSLRLVAGSQGKQLHKKVGRLPRSNPGCFKRPRTPQQEISSSLAKDLDVKDASYKLGSRTIKFFYEDKSQPVKLIGKRGERRNSKIPLKAKHDAYSLKAGLQGFSQAPGGNCVFGTYGLKPDMRDITQLIDDISLHELLDGSYKCPTFAKEKDKRPANTNEKILDSVGKAFFILQHRGPSQVQHTDDIDSAISKKIAPLPSTSNVPLASSIDDAEENSLLSDLSSCTKIQEACINAEVPPDSRDSLLHHPRDILGKLSLPPRKDLDLLMQNTAKLATSSRHSDPNLSKPMSHQFTLPSFSWSNSYNGHSKSNPDSVKVSTRSSCQGKWVKIGNTAGFLGSGSKCFTDIGILVYDQTLVPSGSVKCILPETGSSSSKTINQLVCEQASSSAVRPTPSQTPPALHSPRALAAAQALYNLAHSCPKQTANGIIKWPNQPSQKAMKARKSTSTVSPENPLAPKSETMLGFTVGSTDSVTPLKKHKVSITEKKDHSGRGNAPRVPDTKKQYTSGIFLKPIVMAPMSSRVLEKGNHSQQKLRKILHKDWNRAKG